MRTYNNFKQFLLWKWKNVKFHSNTELLFCSPRNYPRGFGNYFRDYIFEVNTFSDKKKSFFSIFSGEGYEKILESDEIQSKKLTV